MVLSIRSYQPSLSFDGSRTSGNAERFDLSRRAIGPLNLNLTLRLTVSATMSHTLSKYRTLVVPVMSCKCDIYMTSAINARHLL